MHAGRAPRVTVRIRGVEESVPILAVRGHRRVVERGRTPRFRPRWGSNGIAPASRRGELARPEQETDGHLVQSAGSSAVA